MGQREVELDSDLVRDPGMVGELLAAVERDGSEQLAFEGPRHLVSDALGGLAAALAADKEAVSAVDERQQAGAPALPATVSPSQCPGSPRSSAAADRSEISCDTLILPRRSDGQRRRLPRWRSLLFALRPPMQPSKRPPLMPR